ncbi:MAG: hypothetical protein ACP5NC_08115 [Nitrososphaeria archaeon]
MEYWNDEIIQESWEKLILLRSKVKFTLIGGWAVHLYAKLLKSRDINVVVDYEGLEKISMLFGLIKNERLKKYEAKLGRVDVDIYVPYYSKLPIPPEDLLEKFRASLAGFRTVKPEALLALKLGAFADRKDSVKGYKDAVDVLGLLFFSGLKAKDFNNVLEEYKLEELKNRLISLLNSSDQRTLRYLNLNQNSFSKLKRKYINELTEI